MSLQTKNRVATKDRMLSNYVQENVLNQFEKQHKLNNSDGVEVLFVQYIGSGRDTEPIAFAFWG